MADCLIERKERVKVHCRIRPVFIEEIDNDEIGPESVENDNKPATFVTNNNSESSVEHEKCCFVDDEQQNVVCKSKKEVKTFSFDSAFDPTATQEYVYNKSAREIVEDVMEGYNGTIFAYGQTATGKTHTMMGKDEKFTGEERGIIPRCLEDIFQKVNHLKNSTEISVKISYVQIYCERLLDLLEPQTPSSDLQIREDTEYGVRVQGAALVNARSTSDCLKFIQLGNNNRIVASTKMNAHSSRSHAIFIINIGRKDRQASNSQVCNSNLYLVDLAGSERVKKSLVRGIHINELKSINLSLSALGNCISALSQKRGHIPYRDSKLTRLLQYSLGGNAKTSLIINVTSLESELSETLSTLSFGQRAMKVQVKAHLNIIPDYKALYEAIQENVDNRDDRINELEMLVQKLKEKESGYQEQIEMSEISQKQVEIAMQTLKTSYEYKLIAAGGEKSSSDILEINTKWEKQLHEFQSKHHSDLENLKKRFDLQVTTYKKAANNSAQECHNLENELSTEKTSHLETLQEYRKCREKLAKNETEQTERVAELLQQIELNSSDLNSGMDNLKVELADKNKQLADLSEQLTEEKAKQLKYAKSVDKDYVSRENIEQMEKLYSEAIERLQQRVDSLEASKDPILSAPKSLRHIKGALPNKATARQGRVIPGAKKTLSNNNPRFR